MVDRLNESTSLNQIILTQCHKNLSQVNSKYIQKEVDRGTNLRGISKNGRCNWQILMMNLGANAYLGTVDNIAKAGLIYDIFAI